MVGDWGTGTSLNIGDLMAGSTNCGMRHCGGSRVASSPLRRRLLLLILELELERMGLLLAVTTAGTTTTWKVVVGGSKTTHGTGLQLLQGLLRLLVLLPLWQGHHYDRHFLNGGLGHGHCGDGGRVLRTRGLVYLVTHHIAVKLEHVQLAHGAGSVLDEPRVDAVFMELVPGRNRN